MVQFFLTIIAFLTPKTAGNEPIIVCDLLTIQLRHESYRLNHTNDNSATVVLNTKNVVAF